LKAGASGRVKSDEYGKDEARDFVLWKAYDEDDGEVFWETPLGKGRPGWHLECSAMSVKYLGDSFDLHAGGVDLIFPHHENEIAQTEAASGIEFARHWVHCEHLLVEGRKMSKSAGNFYTLRDVFAKGHSPRSVRWLLLTTHYRSQLNFTFKALEQAENTIKKLDGFVERVMSAAPKGGATQGIDEAVEKASKGFEEAMDDDLEISQALPHLFELIRVVNASIDSKDAGGDSLARVLEFLKRVDSILCVMHFEKQEATKEVLALVEKREEARKNKNYLESDRIRGLLKEEGYLIQDTPNGPKLSRASS
jgi:cysteinyl-tRNA synthetase